MMHQSLVHVILDQPTFRICSSNDNKHLVYKQEFWGYGLQQKLPKNMPELGKLVITEYTLAAVTLLDEIAQELFNSNQKPEEIIKKVLDSFEDTEQQSLNSISNAIIRDTYLNLGSFIKSYKIIDCHNSPVFADVYNALVAADRKFFCLDQISAESLAQLEIQVIKTFQEYQEICEQKGPQSEEALAVQQRAKNFLKKLSDGPYSTQPAQSLCGQTITAAPVNFTYDLVLRLVNPKTVYEIGTGPGCQLANTAVLLPESRIVSVEYHEELAKKAQHNLGNLFDETGAKMSQHIEILAGDGFDFEKNLKAWNGEKPEFMYLCAAINKNDPRLSEALRHVRPGGFLLAPVNTGLYLPDGRQVHFLRLYQRTSENEPTKEAPFVDLQSVNFGFII